MFQFSYFVQQKYRNIETFRINPS